jgi:hypothetical protein
MVNKILILVLIVLLFSCKKKEQPETPSGAVNNGNNNGSSATVFSGILQTTKTIEIYNGSILGSTYSPLAYFSNTPTQYINMSSYVTVDSVVLNNVRLNWNNYWYNDPTGSISFPPSTWKVYGNNGIPTFTYTNSDPMPLYTNYNEAPDSINKQTGITILLTGISDYNEATIIISDGTGLSGHTASKIIASGSTSTSFSPADLSNLNSVPYGDYYVILKKNNVQKLSSKDFNFVNQSQYHTAIAIY